MSRTGPSHLPENAAVLPTAACHLWEKNLDQRGGVGVRVGVYGVGGGGVAVKQHAGKHTQRFTTAPLHLADTQPSSGTDRETEGGREEGKQVDKREK